MKARLLLPVFLCAVASGLLAVASLAVPYCGFRGEQFVEVPRGMRAMALARELAASGVVQHRWLFLLARALRPRATLQAGEYRFHRPASVWEVYERLVRGDVFYYELRVPEGSNVFDVAEAVEALGVMSRGDFLDAARDPAAIRDLAPSAPSLEGYLFPSTYRITRQTSAAQLARLMTDEFRRVWGQLGGREDRQEIHRLVTLASLVEKETAVAQERPLVAGVFRNRLERGMRLECDPTVIYAALQEGEFRGVIHRSDLARQNPYNTYQHAGLPPGPIANPGAASLRAALQPARTEFLYFVARPGGNGAHQFSGQLAGHQQAVTRYRRAERKAEKKRTTRRLR